MGNRRRNLRHQEASHSDTNVSEPSLFKIFGHRADNFADICAETEEYLESEVTESSLSNRLIELEEAWRKLTTSYDDAMLWDCTEAECTDLKATKDTTRNIFNNARKSYHNGKATINELLKAYPANRSINSTSSSTPHTPAQDFSLLNTSLSVPPCDTPVFFGSYEEWPAFRDLFTALYIENPRVTPVQCLYFLRQKTKDKAANIVKNYPLSAENFPLAWEALRSRYENKRLLVDKQLHKLLTLPAAHADTGEAVQKIQVTISDCLAILSSQDISTDNWDPIIIHICSSKLPETTLSLWEQSLKNHKDLPTWKEMESFLIDRFETLERVQSIKNPKSEYKQNQNPQSSHKVNSSTKPVKPFKYHNFHNEGDSKGKTPLCKLCDKPHLIRNCPKFLNMSVTERIKFVDNNKMCNNCLAISHIKTDCKSKYTCQHCSKNHNTMLHLGSTLNNKQKSAPRSKTQPTTSAFHAETSDHLQDQTPMQVIPSLRDTTTLFTAHGDNVVLPTALVSIRHEETLFTVRALVDPGSQRSYITERIQKRLSLTTEPFFASVSVMGGKTITKTNKVCNIELAAPNHCFTTTLKAIVLHKLTNFLPTQPVMTPDLAFLGKLPLADPNFNKPAQIDLLLGSDVIPRLLLEGIRKNVDGMIVAQNTVFGWIVSGPMQMESMCFTSFIQENDNEQLSSILQRFWEMEEILEKPPYSEDDKFCEELFQTSTIRQADGRYMVRLPFKQEFPNQFGLGPSRHIALKQYERIEKSLEKEPSLKEKYFDVLKEYITLSHMESCPNFQKAQHEKFNSYYLPHHAVFKPDSTTTKVRVVFNASKRTPTGFSLNDALHVGPALQNDIMTTLIKWRTHKFVFNGDIEKMYRQISIHPDDRPYHRIIFRPDPNGPLKDFQLKTVTFGVNCAPFLAIRTLHQLAQDSECENPQAAAILRHDTYVDDILTGSHDLQTAKQAQTQIREVLASAGFPLKKMTANHEDLLADIPLSDRYHENFLQFNFDSSTKTLGIKWNATTDSFSYALKPISIPKMASKRQIVSISASLYDPAGWLAPITIKAKVLIQHIWREKQDWDACVSPENFQSWTQFLVQLPDIEKFNIPRWIRFHPNNNTELHGFCDASEMAYCAVVYIRSVTPEGSMFSKLFVAKTKVAPLQKITLPRLELCAAVLLSKLVKSIRNELNILFSRTVLWTDSAIVLAWLAKPPYLWKTYVANRVSQIISNTLNVPWRHVPTKENPADLGTRGESPEQLLKNSLWWEGPHWLQSDSKHWPQRFTPVENPPEARKYVSFHTQINCDEVLSNFSTFSKAIRIIAYIQRFVKNCRSKILKHRAMTEEEVKLEHSRMLKYLYTPKTIHEPTYEDFFTSKKLLIVLSQKNYYYEEYTALLENNEISRKSCLLNLNPFLDPDQILRVDGRLKNATLTYSERHPIILSEKSRFCELLLDFTHKALLHADQSLMMRVIRQEYFIPKLKNKVKHVIRRCKPCTLFKQHTKSQIMAALPPERTNIDHAFTVTGVDFAGPFSLKTATTRNAPYTKGYVCVFVCFSTKAIHLEACSDLSTQAFCAAFARFVSRRGLPSTMFSDNGRNFVGANSSLKKEFFAFLKTASMTISQRYQISGLNWKFLPPGAPHMGGLWEAAVKSFKTHFIKTAGNQKFNFEEFTTLLCRIEAVLNSRPISPMTTDPNDLLPLTPAHFLVLGTLQGIPEPPKENISLLNRWERIKALHHQFCRRWKDEYLRELHKRNKWKVAQPDIRIDDFVVIKEDNLPPTEWRLGRVVERHAGRDGKIRVVDIRTSTGIISRPIVKLVLLPFAGSSISNSDNPS